MANDWHLAHLGSRAVDGAGAVFVEASAVMRDGRILPADMGAWSDEHIESGWDLQQSVELAKRLEQIGADLADSVRLRGQAVFQGG